MLYYPPPPPHDISGLLVDVWEQHWARLLVVHRSVSLQGMNGLDPTGFVIHHQLYRKLPQGWGLLMPLGPSPGLWA